MIPNSAIRSTGQTGSADMDATGKNVGETLDESRGEVFVEKESDQRLRQSGC